jgi:putative two-component system response regulator
VQSVASLVAPRDGGPLGHASRTARYATAIGKYYELSDREQEELFLAAFFHSSCHHGDDQPNETLTQAWAEIRECGWPDDCDLAVRRYSERFDENFDNEDQLPLASRIIAVAHAYDELIMPTGALFGCTEAEAAERLRLEAGTMFDPEVVDAFCDARSRTSESDYSGPQINAGEVEATLA